MSRYIDAEKLFNTVGSITPKNAQQYEDIGNFMNMITETPTEDVKPIVRGEWICHYEDILPHCSNCESEWTGTKYMNFCPNCGADMRGE